VYRQGKTFATRPSELVGLTAQPARQFFDRAVFLFGSSLEADLEKSVESKKSASAKKLAQVMCMHRWGVASQFR
jgi:hypothetical protein